MPASPGSAPRSALDAAGIDDYVLLEAGRRGRRGLALEHLPRRRGRHPVVQLPVLLRAAQRTGRGSTRPGRELKAYAEHCVDKYGLRRRIRLETRGNRGRSFDDETRLWRLETERGEQPLPRASWSAPPASSRSPSRPTSRGSTASPARSCTPRAGTHDVDLRGKRVAIIGTGASAVQVIPAIAPEVERLTVFQRTPIWCLPKFDRKLAPAAATGARAHPRRQARSPAALSQTFVELNFPLPAHFDGVVPLAAAGETPRSQAPAPTRSRTRSCATSSRRTTGSAASAPASPTTTCRRFNREPTSTLETDPISRDHARAGSAPPTARRHEVDVLILATGFKVFDPGNMPPIPVHGRDGVDLGRWWDENRFQAYEGVSVPGFPNFFTILGPYGFNGSSLLQPDRDTRRGTSSAACARPASRGATPVEVTARPTSATSQTMLAPPAQPDLLPGHLRGRQQLLLRPPRRRPVPRRHDPRDDLAQSPLRPRRLPLRVDADAPQRCPWGLGFRP